MFHLRSCCNAKTYGKTVLNYEIPVNKYQKKINHMSKLVVTMFIILKSQKLWVRIWSIFHCNVNGEFTFDEQWMKETSRDLTLDLFWFLSKNFFSKIWAAKFRVQLICGYGLPVGAAYLRVFMVCWICSKEPLSTAIFGGLQLNPSHPNIIMHILHTVLWYIYIYIYIYIHWSLYIKRICILTM